MTVNLFLVLVLISIIPYQHYSKKEYSTHLHLFVGVFGLQRSNKTNNAQKYLPRSTQIWQPHFWRNVGVLWKYIGGNKRQISNFKHNINLYFFTFPLRQDQHTWPLSITLIKLGQLWEKLYHTRLCCTLYAHLIKCNSYHHHLNY